MSIKTGLSGQGRVFLTGYAQPYMPRTRTKAISILDVPNIRDAVPNLGMLEKDALPVIGSMCRGSRGSQHALSRF